jgi:hypothetical protein
MVVLTMMALAQPAHVEWTCIIIVVGFYVSASATDFAGLTNKRAFCESTSNQDVGTPPLGTEICRSRSATAALVLAKAFTSAIITALRPAIEFFAALFADLDRHCSLRSMESSQA